ncbi:MAG: hypothetical protein KKA79_08980 [Nanoarchaeota archaeon]|nr:hypothetical protein [Nanoarchaeota archaeon]
MKNKKSIPLIKENRILKLIDVLNCFSEYPYNRENQRDCVLGLYPGKSEKSVFRGMVIPSLRYLSLIIGYEDLIRPSANGRLILESRKKSKKETLRVVRAIVLELDKRLGFIQQLKQLISLTGFINKKDFENLISQEIKGPSEKQREERAKRWIRILEDCMLIKFKNKKRHIILEKENLHQAEKDLEIASKDTKFKDILFKEYNSLPYSETAGVVDIATLRELVAIRFYKEYKLILTESQFDKLLRKHPFITNDYIISFGHPMGAEEKLFYYKDESYRTLSIKFLDLR